MMSTNLGWMILETAGLSFLGLGAQPPTPEWGAMIADGQQYIRTNWWLATVPGLLIVGIGLGLSISHGIITAYGGAIEVESELGKGTRFLVRLPIHRAPKVRSPDRAKPTSTRRGRVLVIVSPDSTTSAEVADEIVRAWEEAVLGRPVANEAEIRQAAPPPVSASWAQRPVAAPTSSSGIPPISFGRPAHWPPSSLIQAIAASANVSCSSIWQLWSPVRASAASSRNA